MVLVQNKIDLVNQAQVTEQVNYKSMIAALEFHPLERGLHSR